MTFLMIYLTLSVVSADSAPAVAEGQNASPDAAATATSADLNAPTLPNTEAANVYTYNPFGKRDPFKSFLSEKLADSEISKDPLLNFDLSKFALTGVLWGIANPKAIVRDGGGRGHIISRGTRMGRNRGQVIRILKDSVVVAEEFRDPLGKLMVSEYTLKLEKKGSLK